MSEILTNEEAKAVVSELIVRNDSTLPKTVMHSLIDAKAFDQILMLSDDTLFSNVNSLAAVCLKELNNHRDKVPTSKAVTSF